MEQRAAVRSAGPVALKAVEGGIQEPWPVVRAARVHLPSDIGRFLLYGYESTRDGKEHLAIVKQPARPAKRAPWLTRIHSECLTGDVLGSHRCDCGAQLALALRRIEEDGRGVVLYMRQEGRGIGLINKLRAYELQERGLDTVEANEHLGFKADHREYGVGVQILTDLGVRRARILTNNPEKASLSLYGFEVVERLPLEVPVRDTNRAYLLSKRRKLGHLLSVVHEGADGPTR